MMENDTPQRRRRIEEHDKQEHTPFQDICSLLFHSIYYPRLFISIDSRRTSLFLPTRIPGTAGLLSSPRSVSLEKLIKPRHSLQESSLLGKLHRLLTHIATDSKPVLDITVQRHLVWNGHFLEKILRLAPLFRGEDLVRFCEWWTVSVSD